MSLKVLSNASSGENYQRKSFTSPEPRSTVAREATIPKKKNRTTVEQEKVMTKLAPDDSKAVDYYRLGTVFE